MTVENNATVLFEDAEIIFLNFAGNPDDFNKTGEKQFCILLSEDQADAMHKDGWNVKRLKPREDEEYGKPYLGVAVGFKFHPPRIVMIGDQSRRHTTLGEETCGVLDDVDIKNVDLMIRARHYDVNGNQGVKAYLKSIYVTIIEDYLELKYAAMDAEMAEGS